MRLPPVVVPAILVLAGALYFFAKAKENSGQWAENSRYDHAAPSAVSPEDSVADEYDRVLVRTLLEGPGLSENQTDVLVSAAGRRYIRRKRAYAAAKLEVEAGRADAAALEPLRLEMESARKVCDVTESLWRKREMTAVVQADWELERRLAFLPSSVGLAERYDGTGTFTAADMSEMEQAFQKNFGKPLPVSTRGESAVHRAMGFDHRGRFDVALSPSQPEGLWARHYLSEKHVTFLAFHSAVPGKATGAHIHIGPPSTHVVPRS